MSKRLRSRFITASLVALSVVICIALVEASAYVILKTNDSGYYKRDFKNSLGLRDPREPTDLRDKRVILALGDSFTYGLGVRYEDSFPGQLDASLHSAHPDFAVVNGGKPGFDTQMAYDRLQRVYSYYEPDYVILGFHSADIVQNRIAFRKLNEETATQKIESVDEQKIQTDIKQREADLPTLFLIKEYLRKSSKTGALANHVYKNYLIKYLPPSEKMKKFGSGAEFEATEYFLDGINDFLSEKNTKFILLSIIPLVRFDVYPYDELNKQLEQYARSRNILFVNPLEELSKFPSSALCVSMNDGHYNAQGNQVISEVLKSALIEQELPDSD